MTTGMGRNANILYSLSVQLYDNLYRCNCQHLPMERKEVIVISLLVEEIALSDALILHHRFSEHGCDRNHSLFVILPVDDDIVLVNIFWLDTAKLQAANPCFKEHRQYRAVTNGLEAVPTAIFHHPLYLFRRKGSNDRLFLFAPDEVSLRVERSVALSIAILNKGLQAFQNAIDVSSLSVTGCEHFYKLPHCR